MQLLTKNNIINLL